MTDTVTVFVKLTGGAFPGAIEGDIRVYQGHAPNIPVPKDWIRFNDVPVQDIPELWIDDNDEGDTTMTTAMTELAEYPVELEKTLGVACDTCGVRYQVIAHENPDDGEYMVVTSPRTGMETTWSLDESPQCNNDDYDHLKRGGSLFIDKDYGEWLDGLNDLPSDSGLVCPHCDVAIHGNDPIVSYPCAGCMEGAGAVPWVRS